MSTTVRRTAGSVSSLLIALSLGACTGSEDSGGAGDGSSTSVTAGGPAQATTSTFGSASSSASSPGAPSSGAPGTSGTSSSSDAPETSTTSEPEPETTSSSAEEPSPTVEETTGVEPTTCPRIEFDPRSDNLADEITVDGIGCDDAFSVVHHVNDAYTLDGRPTSFTDGGWACTVTPLKGELPTGRFDCTKEDARVRWVKS